MSRNKFPGTCYRCGQWVEPGSGHYERAKGVQKLKGLWVLQHAECAIKYRGTKHKTKEQWPKTKLEEPPAK